MRWPVFIAMGAYAVAMGCRNPLLALHLDSLGASAFVLGWTGIGQAIAMIVVPFFFPRAIAGLGVNRVMFLALLLEGAAIPFLWLTQDLFTWFALRVLVGIATAAVVSAGQLWLNLVAPPQHRARYTGWYAVALGGGLAGGASLLAIMDPRSPAPFAVVAVLAVLAGFSSWLCAPRRPSEPKVDARRRLRLPWHVLLAFVVIGAKDTSLANFLPLSGVYSGLDSQAAALLVTAAFVGGTSMPLLSGQLTRAIPSGQSRLMVSAAATGLATFAMIITPPGIAQLLSCFAIGGCGALMFSFAIAELGRTVHFRDLPMAAALTSAAWGAGSLMALAGVPLLLDRDNPTAFLWAFGALHIAFVFALWLRSFNHAARLSRS